MFAAAAHVRTKQQGKVRAIGISNVRIAELRELVRTRASTAGRGGDAHTRMRTCWCI